VEGLPRRAVRGCEGKVHDEAAAADFARSQGGDGGGGLVDAPHGDEAEAAPPARVELVPDVVRLEHLAYKRRAASIGDD